MINNPTEEVVLPKELQAKIDAARNNVVILEETIKLKIAAKQAEEYTISQLIVQKDDLEATIITDKDKITYLEEEISKKQILLSDINGELELSKTKVKELKDNSELVISSLEKREAECLAREIEIKNKEAELNKLSDKNIEDSNKLSEYVNKLNAVINEYKA